MTKKEKSLIQIIQSSLLKLYPLKPEYSAIKKKEVIDLICYLFIYC